MGKHRKAKRRQGLSAEEIALFWMQGRSGHPNSEECDMLWTEEVNDRLRERSLSQKFQAKILEHLPIDDHLTFLHTCETMAAEADGHFEDGVPAMLQLFAIPVHGLLKDLGDALRDKDILTEISRSLRPSGFVSKDSNVCVRPEIFQIEAMGLLDAARIRSLLLDVSAAFGGGARSGATRDLLKETIALVGATDSDPPQENLYGTRFLLGARVSRDHGDLADGLFPDTHEPVEDAIERDQRWYARMSKIRADFPNIMVEPPVAWDDARVEIITCALRSVAMLSVLAEGKELTDLKFSEIQSRLTIHPQELEIKLVKNGSSLAAMTIDQNVVGAALPDLIEAIDAEFPIGKDDEDLALPNFH